MNLKALVLAAATLISTSAFATPQYNGNTYGSEPSYPADAGYYIWNDEAAPMNWHIRWTGTGAAQNVVDWFGSIVFHNSDLGTTNEFSFEAQDQSIVAYDDWATGEDKISWRAATNNSGGKDGIDFSLTSSFELLEFNLGSSLFDNLDPVITDPGVAGHKINIGSGFDTPNVLVFSANGKTYQSFEIAVPEPGTLALLSIGLLGLGVIRRKQAKA